MATCMVCGQAARSDARFCQCGASLVRTCYWCCREVPVDYARCDICGWLDPGHGVTPVIEGRWRSFLALLPHKEMEDPFDCYVQLFHSIWSDVTDGPRYHKRFEEILRGWKYHPNGYYYEPAIKVLDTLFATNGQAVIDFIVRLAMKDEERARAAVVLLRRLGDAVTFGHSVMLRNELCQVAALGALVALAANPRATSEVRQEAVNSLRELVSTARSKGATAFNGLLSLAAGRDPMAASSGMTALERLSMRRSYRPLIENLKGAPIRDIAARAKDLVKRTNWHQADS